MEVGHHLRSSSFFGKSQLNESNQSSLIGSYLKNQVWNQLLEKWIKREFWFIGGLSKNFEYFLLLLFLSKYFIRDFFIATLLAIPLFQQKKLKESS